MASFGILGNPLSHTLSPMLHGMIYNLTNYNGAYNVFEVQEENFGEVVKALRTLRFKGVNVTIPYKQTVMQYLDRLSGEAKEIGAVNTILFDDDGSTIGYNTDYHGFLMQLSCSGVEVKGKRCLICGMSGAGRAVYQALKDAGAAEIKIASTDPKKGIPYNDLKNLPQMDVIVNCTPLGMYPKMDESIVGEEVFSKFSAAVDVVYNPVDTKFLRTARGCGLQTAGGLYMLVFQGLKSFSIWTGINPTESVADNIYQHLLRQFDH